jgi:hypothetical protein
MDLPRKDFCGGMVGGSVMCEQLCDGSRISTLFWLFIGWNTFGKRVFLHEETLGTGYGYGIGVDLFLL